METKNLTTEIIETTNYDLFARFPANRTIKRIDAKTMRLLKESMLIDGFYPYLPIFVWEDPINGKYYIIDGQHREAMARLLKIPLYYRIIENITREEAYKLTIKLNTTQTKWTPRDFIKHYAELGYKEYIKLLEFEKQYKLNGETNVLVLSTEAIASTGHSSIKEGTLILSDRAEERLKFAQKVNERINFKMTRSFTLALRILLKNELEEKYINSFWKNINGIAECANTNQYLLEFEKNINHRLKEKIQINKKF
jgi:hypothetical protein